MRRVGVFAFAVVFFPVVLATAAAGEKPRQKAEPPFQVNPQGRDEEPPAERAWLSANFPWAGRPPFEVQLDQSYYYADEKEAYLFVRLNTANLVKNGTFEQDVWRRGWPDEWARQSWEATRRHHATPGDPASICLRLGEGRYWASQEVKGVTPGKTHLLVFGARAEKDKPIAYQVFWDGNPQPPVNRITEEKLKYYAVAFIPTTDKPVTIKFWCGDPADPASSGLGYFSHVRLFAEDADQRPAWPFSGKEVSTLKANVTLFNTWGGKRDKLAEFTVEGLQPDTTLTRPIPLEKLPATKLGRSFLLVAGLFNAKDEPVTDAQGKPLRAELSFGRIEPPVQVLEPIKKLEWSDDFACFVNGKPFFPIMLYNWYESEFTERDWKVDMPEMRKMGFNTIYLVDRCLDKVKAANLYFLMQRPSCYVEKPAGKQLPLQSLTSARTNFGEWLLAYADSAEYQLKQADAVLEQYKKDKAVDPDRPILQCVQGPSPAKFAAYARTAEIMWPEPHTHDGPFTVNFVQTALDKARDIRGGKAGAWIECATYSPYGPPLLWPGAVRERAWAALARGARGIDWFAHHAHETDGQGRPCGRTKDMAPLTWSELRGLLAEMQYLTPALCAPDHPGIRVSPDMADVVRRDAGGKTYVIAAPSFWYFKGGIDKPWKCGPMEKWDRWTWESGPEGKLAHKNVGTSAHGYFYGRICRLKAGDKLLQEVFVDAAAKLQTFAILFPTYTIQGDYYGIDWQHFACWGSQEEVDKLPTLPGMPKKVFRAGDLPAAGKWTTLEVDADDVSVAGSEITSQHHGRRFYLWADAGALVWWGRSSIKRADGTVVECYGPLQDNRLTITLDVLKPGSTVTSLLDGRVLPVEGSGFKDALFTDGQHGLDDRTVRLYEVTP